ncbi:TrmH family RNA methyltransferase [Saccharicrinis sp. GN24d3]|uniref:TrmH family RNA methyltransferase n=1 Tax=Saccharicrinis sp. GN24d3 TaxID=3458416 RepID=UPI004035610B
MISQNKIKLVNSLNKKKYRDINQLFIAEGEKLVMDLIQGQVQVFELFVREGWTGITQLPPEINCTETTEQYLKKITQLKTPPPIIAICKIPQTEINSYTWKDKLTIALDDIQDPGNLGTIIRLADWFGIENIVCSQNTADAYNPKVVQATMGAVARVQVYYTNLEEFLEKQLKNHIPVYGTFLDGENIYQQDLSENGIIVMGNEGKGISSAIESLVSKKLLIPTFSKNKDQSESLNVSTATGIILSEFRRR